ncbi:putative mitochondrial protein, partial [Mucuna pruriens]
MLIYVDDIIIIGTSPSLMQDIITGLNAVFSLKQLDDLDYFLGIEVNHTSSGSLSSMQNTSGIFCTKWVLALPRTLDDPATYRSIVGALQYVTITWTEIGYAENKVCQFVAQPLITHWTAILALCCNLHLLAFLPACKPSVMLIECLMLMTAGLLPGLWSEKQTLVVRFSTELRPLRFFGFNLFFMNSKLDSSLLTVALSHNPVLHCITKHMELGTFFVREKVLNKYLIVSFVPSLEQVADILTKPPGTD